MIHSPPAKVGYVVKRYPRFSETFIINEILAHEAAGLEVEIFALGFPYEPYFQDAIAKVRAPVRYLPADGLKAVDFWAALEQGSAVLPGFWNQLAIGRGEDFRQVYQASLLARDVKANNVTHLHAHFATSAATVTRLASWFTGVPYTITAHAKDIFHQAVSKEDLSRKFADAAAVVTVSNYNVKYLQRLCGAAAEKIRRIYNGVDLELFPFTPAPNRPPRIVAVGRLVEKKGFAGLIDACALLAQKKRDFICQIVGSGELEAELRQQIESARLEDRVELTGALPQRDVIELLKTASVLVAPSVVGADGNRDGLPNVLLEAMALGTPCVATNIVGLPELIRHEETGLLVNERDSLALAGAIERLLEDRELAARLAKGARRLIETEFDLHHNAAQLRSLFRLGVNGEN